MAEDLIHSQFCAAGLAIRKMLAERADTDLRHGVTPTQHLVLDRIEAQSVNILPEDHDPDLWPDDWQERLNVARAFAKVAVTNASLAHKYDAAISAAALLIDAADEIARLIGPAAILSHQPTGEHHG